jgi:cytosine/uracil/thiamine/allantoin permease
MARGGLVVPSLRPPYDYAWFVGLFMAAAVYWSLSARGSVATEPSGTAGR